MPRGSNPNSRRNLKRAPGPGRPKGSKSRLTVARVEQELRHIALSDPILMFDKTYKGRRRFTLRDLDQMPEDMRRCIASVKVRTENLTAGDDAQDETVEVRLWDKTKALELCARVLGMLKDKTELSADADLLRRIALLNVGRAANAKG